MKVKVGAEGRVSEGGNGNDEVFVARRQITKDKGNPLVSLSPFWVRQRTLQCLQQKCDVGFLMIIPSAVLVAKLEKGHQVETIVTAQARCDRDLD